MGTPLISEQASRDSTGTAPSWAEVAERLDAHFGGAARIVAPKDAGAYSPAARWIVTLGDGIRAFVKADRDDAAHVSYDARACLLELGWYQPRVLAWLPGADGGISVLVTEDLSGARWGLPLEDADATALHLALNALAEHDAPTDIPRIIDRTAPTGGGIWAAFETDPTAFVATGQADEQWCADHLATLAAAADAISLDGDGVVHGDPWRQNWCTHERGAVLVDWTSVSRGNPMINHAWGECSVRACDGPHGFVLAPDHPEHDAWAAWMSGQAACFLADDISRHDVRNTRPALWATQARECRAGLVWACTALDIPLPEPVPGALPDGPWEP